MIERKKLILITLIHNNNLKRNLYIQPFLKKLQTALSGQFDVKLTEVAYQSEIKPHSRLMVFVREIIQYKLNLDWFRYRLLKPPFLLRYIASFFKSALKKSNVMLCGGGGGSLAHPSAVEIALTSKHIRAWEVFLETGGDFLICFEDDVVFKDDSIQRTLDLLNYISQDNENKSTYIDLAGGCELQELKIDKLESYREKYFRYYNKPVTNTICGYLLSRTLVACFHDQLLRRPWLRLIGADWMINSLLILLDKSRIQCNCMHSDPTIFKHGSVTGEYTSWIRKNH
jgi:hypothetical protein